MSFLSECIESAHLAQQSNFTIGDERWRLKQLYQLYQLVLDQRDELIAASARVQSESPEACEREVAFIVKEIHSHIENEKRPASKAVLKSSHLGQFRSTLRPCGVNIIIYGQGIQLRVVIGTLAASIAAGNVTVLVMAAGKNDPLFKCLARFWSKYLDERCNFLRAGFEDSSLVTGDGDSIFIYDASPDGYSMTLSLPNAHFRRTSRGLNLVVIADGNKAWKEISDEIRTASGPHCSVQDQVDAVFVLEQDAELLRSSLSPARVIDITATGSHAADLDNNLQSTNKSGSPLVVVVASVDRIIDIIINSARPVQQLAVLGQNARTQAEYFRQWVTVGLVAVGFIYPFALSSHQGHMSPTSHLTLFPTNEFSRYVLLTEKPPEKTPLTVAALRKSYEGLISPLAPEPRGERLGFFGELDYLIKGIKATAVLLGLTGLYFGTRWVQRRL